MQAAGKTDEGSKQEENHRRSQGEEKEQNQTRRKQ